MNILIILPSRSRRIKCFETLEQYRELSTSDSTRFLLSCDEDDLSMNNEGVKSLVGRADRTEIVFNKNTVNTVDEFGSVKESSFTTKIQAINSGAIRQDFDICLLASDDMIPEIKGYDSIIKTDMQQFFPDTDGVLWYNDGYQGDNLNTLCILGKKYYERFGYIYHPSYITLYCDNEFTKVSQKLKKCQYINKTIIRHEHWSNEANKNKRDELDKKNDQFVGYDQMNFNKRLANDFK